MIKGNQVLSNLVANQEVHSRFGGVVPELASRAHQSNIVPTLSLALKDANVNLEDIDAVAYTNGPGLSGSLLVGSSFAKSWAWANDLHLLPCILEFQIRHIFMWEITTYGRLGI